MDLFRIEIIPPGNLLQYHAKGKILTLTLGLPGDWLDAEHFELWDNGTPLTPKEFNDATTRVADYLGELGSTAPPPIFRLQRELCGKYPSYNNAALLTWEVERRCALDGSATGQEEHVLTVHTEGIEGEIRADLSSPPLWSSCLQSFAALAVTNGRHELIVVRVGASIAYEESRKPLRVRAPHIVAFAGEAIQIRYTSLFGIAKTRSFSLCDMRFSEQIYENLTDLLTTYDPQDDGVESAPLL